MRRYTLDLPNEDALKKCAYVFINTRPVERDCMVVWRKKWGVIRIERDWFSNLIWGFLLMVEKQFIFKLLRWFTKYVLLG